MKVCMVLTANNQILIFLSVCLLGLISEMAGIILMGVYLVERSNELLHSLLFSLAFLRGRTSRCRCCKI